MNKFLFILFKQYIKINRIPIEELKFTEQFLALGVIKMF